MICFERIVAEVPSARRSKFGTGSAWNPLIIATARDSLNVQAWANTEIGRALVWIITDRPHTIPSQPIRKSVADFLCHEALHEFHQAAQGDS